VGREKKNNFLKDPKRSDEKEGGRGRVEQRLTRAGEVGN